MTFDGDSAKVSSQNTCKINGIICNQSANLQTDTSPKNDRNSTFSLPNLMNDISTKTYRSIESKEVKKLWSKIMSRPELKFFTNTFILGTLF